MVLDWNQLQNGGVNIDQQGEGLVDRLNKIDAYTKSTRPIGLNYIANLERPAGANPLTQYGAMDDYINGSLAKDEYDKGMQALNTLLGFKSDQDRSAQSKVESDRDYQLRLAELGAKGITINGDGTFTVTQGIEGMDDAKAIAEVQKKYGKDIQLGKTTKERGERARSILRMEQEGTPIPLADIMSEKELTARTNATSLMNEAGAVNSKVTDQAGNVINAPGVGILGGRSFNPLTALTGRGQDVRSLITNLTAAKIKELSGAAVSDREVQRLVGMLPQITDTEQVIAAKTKTLMNSIKIGLELQEKAKRENLTLDQAYEKYGADIYTQHQEEIPSWLKDVTSKSNGSSDNNRPPLSSFER